MTLAAFAPGHLHPLLVHLPIGILYLVGILAFMGLWKRTDKYRPAITQGLGFGFIAALLALGSGWLMAGDGGYDETTLSRHFWLAIATTAATLLLWTLSRMQLRSRRLFAFLMAIVLTLLTFTGHLGGQMTHGSDFLFQSTPKHKQVTDLDKAEVYADLVAPILSNKCTSCHGAKKQKGELDLSNIAGIQKGGESGTLFSQAEQGAGELIHRINLSQEAEDHMPPDGKTQLLPEEIQILSWWAEHGGCVDCAAASLTGFASIKPALEKLANPFPDVERASEAQLAALAENDIDITWASESDPMLGLSLEFQSDIKRGAIKALKSLAENISYLSVAGSVLSDDLMDVIADMPNLRQLMAQQTNLEDEHISSLSELAQLEVLNVYGTEVSDESLETLQALPNLQRLYVWQSGLSADGLAQLSSQREDLEVITGETGNIFPPSQLNPPGISAETEMFKDSLLITLESPIPDATIRYTTDGSPPSPASRIYREPFSINHTQRITAAAEKEGWLPSESAGKQFFQTGPAVKSISLARNPNPTYAAQGAETLVDHHLGEPGVMNGQWLGYQGRHLTTTLELEETQVISSVFVSALSNPGSWVFFPKGAKVWTSSNGRTFKQVASETWGSDQRVGEAVDCFHIALDSVEARFVKVKVESVLRNPSWHPSAGERGWLFVGEILVE